MSTRLSAFLVTTAASSLTSLLGTLQPAPASHELVLRPTPSSDDEDEELSPRSLKPLASVSTQLCLSTNCDQCGSAVSVQVPIWITEMMETAGTGPKRANGGEEEDLLRRKEWREGIVQGAVSLAIAVKESPLPALLLAGIKYAFIVCLYLDARFALHQRLALFVGAVMQGLMEIEKEVGLFRGVGEAISVVWEASVKSALALGKPDSVPPAKRREAPVPSTSSSSPTHGENPPSYKSHSTKSERPSSTAHSRSHAGLSPSSAANSSTTANRRNPSPRDRERGSSTTTNDLYSSKSHLSPTLRRTSRSTSSLKSKTTSTLPYLPFPSSLSTAHSVSSPCIPSGGATSYEPRRRSRSATGGSDKSFNLLNEEKGREVTEEERRRTASQSWAGRALGAVGRNLGRT